ncbi:hypothetical protein XENOCAPTIV_025078 [Xenoophorus captivus]|uniref:Uncharacterized protein n=1 Tax=Xenoophorus captivus TaxID=1517983 RepID=A0ABV0QFB6_9TELE
MLQQLSQLHVFSCNPGSSSFTNNEALDALHFVRPRVMFKHVMSVYVHFSSSLCIYSRGSTSHLVWIRYLWARHLASSCQPICDWVNVALVYNALSGQYDWKSTE